MEDLEFVILSGGNTRTNCPTSTIVKTKEQYSGHYWLKDEENGMNYSGYVYRKDEDHLEIFVILDHMTRKSEIELTLSEDQPNIDPKCLNKKLMKIIEKENKIEIFKNGKLFTIFRYASNEDELSEETGLRPNFMPLKGPYGNPITRQYPIKKNKTDDHIHHRSLWSAWGEVNGADNWAEGLSGVPQFVRNILIKESGHALTHLQLDIEWMGKDGETPNLKEIRDVFIFNTMGTEIIIEYRIKLTAAYEDVTFGDTKEAGFCSIRVADNMRGAVGGLIENNFGGQMEPECWGKKASWCDYSGKDGGFVSGITIMDHPENPGFPCRWHVRNYGLMSPNPFGLKDFLNDKSLDGSYLLKKGDSLNFNYRIFLHAGDCRQGNVNLKYLDYVNPPELKYLDF